MRLSKFFFVLCCWLLFRGVTHAQDQQYKFSHISIDDGLSDSRAKCFLKDQKGFIWIGTLFGLNRYDGYALKTLINNPKDTASLQENDVDRLYEDHTGKIWITTHASQNVYDPRTETIIRNTDKLLDNYGIPHGFLNGIVKGYDNRYWYLHKTKGLFKQSSGSKNTVWFGHTSDTLSIDDSEITGASEDGSGGIWVTHRNGIFERIDVLTGRVLYRNHWLSKSYGKSLLDYDLLIDSDGDIWIYGRNDDAGVFCFDKTGVLRNHLLTTSHGLALTSNIVRGVVQDDQGKIWIATDGGGINILDKRKNSIQYIHRTEEDEQSLSQNSIGALFKDRDGFIWIGTFKKGVNIYHENLIRFKLYQHHPSDQSSLPYNDINVFAEDDKGNIWIGTNGGGLIYFDRTNHKFTRFRHDPANDNSVSSDVIVSLFFDRNKRLWIGTYYEGLNLYDGKHFTHYRHSARDTTSIGDNHIWEVYEDSQQRIWIGTLGYGVDLMEKPSGRFKHFNRYLDPHSVHAAYVPTILEDSDNNVWFGTGYGLNVLPKGSTEFKQYLNNLANPSSLSNNSVVSLLEDSRKNLWIGTMDGLNLFDKTSGTFKIFTTEEGLPHNTVWTVKEDNKGNLWIGTSNGLSNLILTWGKNNRIEHYQFRNFGQADGLQGKQFNEGAALKLRSGEMVFGGSNGFNLFDPATIAINNVKPTIRFSDFQISNRSIKAGELVDGRIIFPQSINYTTEIVLKNKENVFSLELVSLNFFHEEKIQYKYKLIGFDKDWTYANAADRKVTYTNLNPGDYTFVAQASNNDGIWSDEEIKLKITVLPPFWKTKTAFMVYFFLALGVIFLFRKLILLRERTKYKIELERTEALQVHEMDLMKIKFLTNVSHEFRTPLSLILAPVERLIDQATNEDLKGQYRLIYRNAKRLLNMVNLLLDFRKMEAHEIKLNLSEGDIIEFIKDTANSFSDLSEKKSITFSVNSNTEHWETFFDKDKLEKILFNLLSNAFKFTPERGKIGVSVNVITKFNAPEKWLEIRVSDTGIGIPAEKHDKIFERFFQHDMPAGLLNQGSGIGLSITKEFVTVHGGTISVESEPEKGSTFIVSIPLPEIQTQGKPMVDNNTIAQVMEAKSEEPEVSDSKVILLIEDNDDFRFYLKDNLKSQYRVLEARNGNEGYDSAVKGLPDLIVSDVMMPDMNGLELCKKIKTNKITSHIPIILLTARSSEEQKIEGFETGADDYITKPFSFEILQSRIKNLTTKRENAHKEFRKLIDVKTSEINITSLDQKFIQNAIKLVEDNINNPNFWVEALSQELGISRVHLYKKLLSLTGKAPLEFMRTIRIQRAAQLLAKSQLTVAQIAYQVGFNNPKYFAKYFKDEYNETPSKYAASKKYEE